jgi:hypothetical protein
MPQPSSPHLFSITHLNNHRSAPFAGAMFIWRPDRRVEKSNGLLNDGAGDLVDRVCMNRFRQPRQHRRGLMASDTILVVDDEADWVHQSGSRIENIAVVFPGGSVFKLVGTLGRL